MALIPVGRNPCGHLMGGFCPCVGTPSFGLQLTKSASGFKFGSLSIAIEDSSVGALACMRLDALPRGRTPKSRPSSPRCQMPDAHLSPSDSDSDSDGMGWVGIPRLQISNFTPPLIILF
jgi:hypothetical protein